MTKRYEWQAEAHQAVIDHFQERNAARGQYPQRISPKRTMKSLETNGDVVFEYTYKSETVTMVCGCYYTEVTI